MANWRRGLRTASFDRRTHLSAASGDLRSLAPPGRFAPGAPARRSRRTLRTASFDRRTHLSAASGDLRSLAPPGRFAPGAPARRSRRYWQAVPCVEKSWRVMVLVWMTVGPVGVRCTV